MRAAKRPRESPEASIATTVCGLELSSCLFNSSNPYATTLADLQTLKNSAAGAVATRTACPGFVHDAATMKWYSPDGANTINCLGYSPKSFEYYIDSLQKLACDKPAWLSISGYASEVRDMIAKAGELAQKLNGGLAVEINLSCPNIAGKPPIAYDFEGMREYLAVMGRGPNPGPCRSLPLRCALMVPTLLLRPSGGLRRRRPSRGCHRRRQDDAVLLRAAVRGRHRHDQRVPAHQLCHCHQHRRQRPARRHRYGGSRPPPGLVWRARRARRRGHRAGQCAQAAAEVAGRHCGDRLRRHRLRRGRLQAPALRRVGGDGRVGTAARGRRRLRQD